MLINLGKVLLVAFDFVLNFIVAHCEQCVLCIVLPMTAMPLFSRTVRVAPMGMVASTFTSSRYPLMTATIVNLWKNHITTFATFCNERMLV